MISSLELVMGLALATVAVIDLTRTLLWKTWLAAHKPLSCDTCMSWWIALVLAAVMRFAWPETYAANWRSFVWTMATAASAAGASILILAAQRYFRNDLAGPPPQI